MNSPTLKAILAIAVSFAVPQAAAQTRSPAASARVDAGYTLAQLTYPAQLEDALLTYTFIRDVSVTYHADPNLQALDRKHPGIIDGMAASLSREYGKARTAALPLLWTRLGAAYAARLDLAELRQANAFFGDAASRRLLALVIEGLAKAPPPEAAAENAVIYPPDPRPDDAMAQEAFAETTAGRKLQKMQAEVAGINDAWSAKAVPDEATMSAELAKVLVRFGASASDLPRAPARK